MFSHANVGSVQILVNALNLFCSFTGLQLNPAKSKVFFSRVDNQAKASILSLLQFQAGSLPVSYLGLPLSALAIKVRDCQTLVEKITRRVGSWTFKFLSYAGRTVLIKSVLCSIQSYWSQSFVLPKKVFDEVNKILRRFYWSGVELKKGCAKVAWTAVCRLEIFGGLGFLDLELPNRIANLKHIWKLCSRKDCLWVAWTTCHLLRSRSFWCIKPSVNYYGFWRSLLKLRGMARGLIRYRVGCGKNTNLWLDYWLPNGPIVQQIGLNDVKIL
ncbi:uncharacterized protein LOC132272976 [Cornus florida]|uniref:uncharacterized protein LOC132272976 n=1 Tax=Cornus florida TaxID=4283 RepID=UPI0028A2CD25|nr:uncharacterized protein LOC132272976 [Cornus florida]